MDSPDRYTEVWKARFAEFVAQGVPEDRARTMASESAAAQILSEVRGKLGGPPPVVPAAPQRKLRMARGDAIGLIAMGGLSILVGIMFRDVFNALGGLLIGACGLVELSGFRRFVARRPQAREYLVGSQLGVLALIWVYCGWQLFGPKSANSPETQELMNQLGADAAEFGGLMDSMTRMVYLVLAGVSLLYQGGLALYYWRKTEA
jgi:hypothetical protein